MADIERRQFEIGLEFVRWSFAECNNFSEGSSEPKKDAQVIWVRGRQPHEFFLTPITCSWGVPNGEILKSSNLDTYGCYLPTGLLLTVRCELIFSVARPSLLFFAQGAWWDGRSRPD